MNETQKRRWFRFSIRDAAIALVALGFALAWYKEHQALLAEREVWAPIRSAAENVRVPVDKLDKSFDGLIDQIRRAIGNCVDFDIDGIPLTVTVDRRERPPLPKMDPKLSLQLGGGQQVQGTPPENQTGKP